MTNEEIKQLKLINQNLNKIYHLMVKFLPQEEQETQEKQAKLDLNPIKRLEDYTDFY